MILSNFKSLLMFFVDLVGFLISSYIQQKTILIILLAILIEYFENSHEIKISTRSNWEISNIYYYEVRLFFDIFCYVHSNLKRYIYHGSI